MAYKDSPIKTAVAAALEIRPQHGRVKRVIFRFVLVVFQKRWGSILEK
jgi:hypothetical protein